MFRQRKEFYLVSVTAIYRENELELSNITSTPTREMAGKNIQSICTTLTIL